MNKVIKWVVLVLMVIGIGFTANVYVSKGSDLSVSLLLYWTYAMVGLALVSIVGSIVASSVAKPKTLVTLGCVVVGCAIIIGIAWLLAPGSPALGIAEDKQPSPVILKLTDTVLYLTIFAIGAAVLSIVVNFVVGLIKK